MPEHQHFGHCRPVAAEQHDDQAECPAGQYVDDLEQHPPSQPSPCPACRQLCRSTLNRVFERHTVAPWFRGLFAGSPDVTAIAHAPVIYQIHVTAAWLIWAVWPFSRLVHAWSYPLWYLWRPYIVYRSRRAVPPAEPGTGGRRWRKIGVPY